MLSKKAIQTQIENYEEMMGDDYRDLTKVLQSAMTVGELKELLEEMDDSLPVRLDVLRVEKNGDLSAEEGFLLATREIVSDINEDEDEPLDTEGEGDEDGESDAQEIEGQSEALVLVACSSFSPEAFDKYPEEFE